jgi:hypothetical protein
VTDGQVTNVTFSLNSADNGGGMLNRNGSTLTITGDLEGGCLFENNQAVSFGGGMANFDASPVITNCAFIGNDADDGGGIYNAGGGEHSISGEQGSCLFDANTAWVFGGAISNRNVTLSMTGCTLQGSEITYSDPWSPDIVYWGGAVYNLNTTLTLTDCTFSNNKCTVLIDDAGWLYYEGRAGAMWIEGGTAELTGCTFQGNSAGWTGGALEIRSSNATLTDCQFLQNQILETGGAGGGMYIGQSTGRLDRCLFQANTTPLTDGTWESLGGALDSSSTTLTVRNTVFKANLSDYSAIFIGGTYPVTMEGCVISDNHGYLSAGAISHGGNILSLVNCSIINNTAAADCSVMWLGDAHATITNSIIWGNHGTAGSLPLFAGILSHSVTINHSDVQGGHAGNNNVNVDPLLDANLQPQASSAAEIIDSGDNSVVTEEVDLAGAPRIFNNIVDMGAYEWQGGAK